MRALDLSQRLYKTELKRTSYILFMDLLIRNLNANPKIKLLDIRSKATNTEINYKTMTSEDKPSCSELCFILAD